MRVALVTTAEFIAHWEGFRELAYHDVAGYPTIGYGRKLSNEKWADLQQFPDTTQEAEADHLLIPKFRAGVERIITMHLEPDEETALCHSRTTWDWAAWISSRHSSRSTSAPAAACG